MAQRPQSSAAPASGFTLIEVLVTVVILSAGIVMVLRAFSTSLRALADSRDVLLVTHAMRTRLAQAQAAAAGGGTRALQQQAGAFRDSGGCVGTVRVSAVPARTSPARGKDAVTLSAVSVTAWRDGSDVQHELSTYIRSFDEPPASR